MVRHDAFGSKILHAVHVGPVVLVPSCILVLFHVEHFHDPALAHDDAPHSPAFPAVEREIYFLLETGET